MAGRELLETKPHGPQPNVNGLRKKANGFRTLEIHESGNSNSSKAAVLCWQVGFQSEALSRKKNG